MSKPEKISIDGVDYVRSDLNHVMAENEDGLEYVIIRADRAGVFAGYLSEEDDESHTVVLLECRRIYYWDGAASISELSVNGVSKPQNCKFPVAVKEAKISGVIEIIKATEKARKSIQAVKVWSHG